VSAHGSRLPATRPAMLLGGMREVAALCTLASVLAVGVVAETRPEWSRWLFALVVGMNLLIIAAKWPRIAVVLTLLLLPFLALARRLLIADAGWTSYDPLLLIAPAVAVFLVQRLYGLERRRLVDDRLSMLVVGLLVLELVESLNPLGGGALAGVGGLLFLAAPLLWFFIGRAAADRRMVEVLVYGVVVLAVAIGLYGFWQSEIGLPTWDASWVNLNGFVALNVGGVIRPFGTFSSATEYAAFLGVAVAFATAMAMHRRSVLLLAVPFLAVALFLASSRTALVLTLMAVIILFSLRTGRPRTAATVAAVSLIAAFLAVQLLGPAIQRSASKSGNPLVTHQVGGLVDPTNPDQSTLIVHMNLVLDGVKTGITHPYGQGTGVTNIAGNRLGSGGASGTGGSSRTTEIDVSNVFVSLGIVGGLLFLAIIFITFRRVISLYMTRRDPALLAIVGLLVITLGQWLNGGHYAVAPLTWLLIGWATGRSAAAPEDEPAASDAR
jgi:hypothetical protein